MGKSEGDLLYEDVTKKAKALHESIGKLAEYLQKTNRRFNITYSFMAHRVDVFRIDLGTIIKEVKEYFGQ